MEFKDGAARGSEKEFRSQPINDLIMQKEQFLRPEIREKGVNAMDIGKFRDIFAKLKNKVEKRNS